MNQNLKTSGLLVKRKDFSIYMERVISNAFLNFTISPLTLDYQLHQYWQQTEKFVVVATKHQLMKESHMLSLLIIFFWNLSRFPYYKKL